MKPGGMLPGAPALWERVSVPVVVDLPKDLREVVPLTVECEVTTLQGIVLRRQLKCRPPDLLDVLQCNNVMLQMLGTSQVETRMLTLPRGDVAGKGRPS